jgi:hypothetical protein
VSFENPLGFRVVEERDLMEYWPVCSTPAGWLFRIHSGGWLEERTRRGSLMLDMYPDVKEYLITGINDCVSVLSTEMPSLSDYQPSSIDGQKPTFGTSNQHCEKVPIEFTGRSVGIPRRDVISAALRCGE